ASSTVVGRLPIPRASVVQLRPSAASIQQTLRRQMSDKTGKSGLLRSSAVVSVMTLLSRVLGMVRAMVVANYFGSGAAADAFFIAFKIPNFLRRLFAEGAFAQAFVPVLS